MISLPLETALQSAIFPQLELGRPGWDLPHTQAVVHHIKEIIANAPTLNLDATVLVIAAYAHDWGYANLFRNGEAIDLQQIVEAKTLHMAKGAENLKALLEDPVFDSLSEAQRARAVHLVAVHDKVKDLADNDELVLMEADTLGGLDVEFTKPSFSLEDNQKYMDNVLNSRRPKFITEFGKKKFEELFKARQEYYRHF